MQNSTRKYHRVEDGRRRDHLLRRRRLISSNMPASLTKSCAEEGPHLVSNSLPYVKGMLHEVDFMIILTAAAQTPSPICGVQHPIQKVDIILTKSMSAAG